MNTKLSNFILSRSIKLPQVIFSKCQNIFYNLALEDWIYNNVKFVEGSEDNSHAELVMIWRNEPCIVVGRHQNPWIEADVAEAGKRGVSVARRRSGGGCVYHDLGNINLTFFTSKKFYNRKRNLHFVSNHLKEKWGLDVGVNKRDDIMLKNIYKVSGTAAKLGSDVAYHHLTFLVSADLNAAKRLLSVSKDGMISNATASTPSLITNLSHHHPSLTTDLLIDSLVKKYSYPDQEVEEVTVDPMDASTFEGIDKLASDLRAWSWVYGHTPKFNLTHSITIPSYPNAFNVSIEVDKGVVKGVELVGDELVERYALVIDEAGERLKGLKWCGGEMQWSGVDGDDEVSMVYKIIVQYLSSLG